MPLAASLINADHHFWKCSGGNGATGGKFAADEMNRSLPVVIVAPITSSKKPWPTLADIKLSGKTGEIMLDQISAVDKTRLTKRIAEVDVAEALDALQIMFTL